MEVFRITLAKWSNNLVASNRAARWNSDGVQIIYAASYRSLACLENIVHRDKRGFNDNFRIMIIDIPDDKIEGIKLSNLPVGWNATDAEAFKICRKIGDDWVTSNRSLVLEVPSAIIKDENNYLINVNNSNFDRVKLVTTEPFFFDPRLNLKSK